MTTTLLQTDFLHWLSERRWLAQQGEFEKFQAVFCDPPYGLEFMGREWDKFKPAAAPNARGGKTARPGIRGEWISERPQKYVAGHPFQEWVTLWGEMLLDYVHPGALGLFFGGTRTYHRVAAGLEDAGWEIADCIHYLYGSG